MQQIESVEELKEALGLLESTLPGCYRRVMGIIEECERDPQDLTTIAAVAQTRDWLSLSINEVAAERGVDHLLSLRVEAYLLSYTAKLVKAQTDQLNAETAALETEIEEALAAGGDDALERLTAIKEKLSDDTPERLKDIQGNTLARLEAIKEKLGYVRGELAGNVGGLLGKVSEAAASKDHLADQLAAKLDGKP
jgi:hypothetical protein